MSYSDEWLKAVHARRQQSGCACPEYGDGTANIHRSESAKPVEPAPVTPAPAWKPWAEMTPEERRKALENRQEKKDATPRPSGR